MIGTLFIANVICIRLWLIMAEIREAVNDPMAMALIITDNGIKSDSAQAEQQLQHAQSGFEQTEQSTAIFSVCLAMITIAMIGRLIKKYFFAPKAITDYNQHTNKKRPLSL